MITEKGCRNQIARLSTVPLYVPSGDAALLKTWTREWLSVMQNNCQSDEHCAAAMSALLTETIHCENPLASFVAIARSTWSGDQAPPGCDRCRIGPDLTTGEMRWASHVSAERNGCDCAVRCDCARGRWLAVKDGERKAAAPESRKSKQLQKPNADFQRRAANDPEAA